MELTKDVKMERIRMSPTQNRQSEKSCCRDGRDCCTPRKVPSTFCRSFSCADMGSRPTGAIDLAPVAWN